MHREVMRLQLRDFVLREVVYSPGMRMPRHAHDYSNLTVLIGGEIEEAAPAGRYRGRPGSVLLKPAGCEHENGVSGFGARTLSIQLTRGALASELSGREWTWLEQAQVVRAAVALTRHPCEEHAMELLATALHAPRSRAGAPQWLSQILRTLEERFDESLRLDALARDHGLHPVYVSRAFRQHAGMTMQEYVRTLRLRHARHLLGATKRSIGAIAAEAGFTDASHLSRTFNQQLGLTPKSFRNVARQVQSVQIAMRDTP